MKAILLILTPLLMTVACTKKELKTETQNHVEARTLTVQLAEQAQQSAQQTPKETRQTMVEAIRQLKESEILSQALKKGDKIPSFALPDVQKGQVQIDDLLKKGPVVLTFYRGGWCPYCNLQLRDLQKHLPGIKQAGAELVAISPETPDSSAKTIKDNGIEYYVLSDADGKVGKQFGLMFHLNDDLKKVYQKFGIDLEKTNGNKDWELPLAATYIVDKNGLIIFSFVDADYKRRAETTELIEILKSI